MKIKKVIQIVVIGTILMPCLALSDRLTNEVSFYYNKIGFSYATTTDGDESATVTMMLANLPSYRSRLEPDVLWIYEVVAADGSIIGVHTETAPLSGYSEVTFSIVQPPSSEEPELFADGKSIGIAGVPQGNGRFSARLNIRRALKGLLANGREVSIAPTTPTSINITINDQKTGGTRATWSQGDWNGDGNF